VVNISAYAIEQLLYSWRFTCGDSILVPNVVYPWECDFVGVTKAGYAHEFEIKISRSDFKADFKKDKHAFITGEREYTWKISRPAYLWFVVPFEMVTLDEVPEYAGLIYVSANGKFLKEMRRPKKIHNEKVSDKYRMKLLQSMMYRFWQVRRQLKGVNQ